MAPNRTTEFRYETYKRLTLLTKNRFTNIKTVVDKLGDTDVLSQLDSKTLTGYLSEIERKKADFETNFQRTIQLEEDVPLETLTEDQDLINNEYIYLTSKITALLPSTNSETNRSEHTDSPIPQAVNSPLKLPKLNLPTFSGNLETWIAFINLFNATVHSNPDIDPVLKFQYLLSVLRGEALNIVKSLNLTADNYVIAYQLLIDRYQNDRRLKSFHLNNLLDLPSVTASRPQTIRQFINSFNENTQALSALKCPVTGVNPVLSAMLMRKMDVELRKRFETFRSSNNNDRNEFPDVNCIITFLTKECVQHEDALSTQHKTVHDHSPFVNRFKQGTNNKSGFTKRDITMLATHSSENTYPPQTSKSCFFCNSKTHTIYHCPDFKSKSPKERYNIVKQARYCISCLGNHSFKQCQSTKKCLTCQKPHHTMLHFGDTMNPPSHDSHMVNKTTSFHSKTLPTNDNGLATTASVSLTSNKSLQLTNHTVLLGTLLIRLQTAEGHSHVFRALLDSGSMCDLISERAVNLLHAHRQKSTIQLTGINQTAAHHRGQIVATISTPSGQLIAPHQQLLILDKITVDIPRKQLAPEVFQKAQSFNLADPSFHIPGHIDMVIGNSLFPQLLTQDQHSLGADMPYIVGTRFGYVVMGNAPCDASPKPIAEFSSTTAISCHLSSDSDLHEDLQRFWRQEEPPVASNKSHEENICDQHFADTHERDSTGRYIVRLPLKDSKTALGNSMLAAKTRLHAMERKFDRDDRFSNLYHNFMSEYLDLKHMSPHQNVDFTQPHYFLPHHGVLRESSSTTKLRTVFDASCPSSSGKSLNDISFVGKRLQSNICDILLQFRRHNVVFCCDIKQMYRQILIHPDDRDLQLILWREHSSQPIQIFQLNTVTYGVNSSPYLAIRTLHQLADDEGNQFPEAAFALKNHTYVDDIITGADTPSEAKQLKHQLLSLLKCGGFELRKWISNSAELLSDLPENHLEIPKFINDPTIPHFKVLGLQWSPTTDVFSYNTQFPSPPKLTKRIILSIIATLYDPCGFLSPFLLLTKRFMQLMWTNLCHWDEVLPLELSDKWKVIAEDTKYLKEIQVPRSFDFTASTDVIQLHGFCDASESGYSAVVYFRIESQSHVVATSLVMAKSKVAPLKRVTLPRLELCAAHLLAKLIYYCRNLFTNLIPTTNTYLWSDSTIALTWLQTPSYKLKTYVANRVAQTQELIPNECWNHVASDQNPADCASRGLLPSHLINHNIWWTGPEWLKLPSCNWPKTSFSPVILDSSLEIKSNPLPILLLTNIDEDVLLNRYSSWTKLQRITALVLRFIHNCRSSNRRTGFLTTNELSSARLKIFWCVQQASFGECISSLKNNHQCSKNIVRLQPFLDDNGLIRVGGRLKLAPLAYDVKHPILLPKHHHVTHILINHCHVSHLHAGPQLTQSILSQTVWILSARSVIRSQIHKCLCCFKHKPMNNAPLMGDLPMQRVTPSKPFLSTGIDYGGPFTIKILNSRSAKHVKVYICIFICMVTKAVHIEVSHDLSTDSFIACLTRFISRRGHCSHIYSDCGTNLVGANNEMKRIIKALKSDSSSQESIHRFASEHHIQFHFNPPAAPHHGGLWENAIKQAKHHLLRTIGCTVLTLPEFITLSTKVEAMINSRPLTPLSNDPADLNALTPSHFLVGGPMVPLPEEDLMNIPSNRLSHWQQVQQMSQHIWRRWSLEYLHTLQQRHKWNKQHENLKVGDLVLMNTQSPPFKWPLARVTTVYPGPDNIVRVADVKTALFIFIYLFKRPVVKLFPLINMKD